MVKNTNKFLLIAVALFCFNSFVWASDDIEKEDTLLQARKELIFKLRDGSTLTYTASNEPSNNKAVIQIGDGNSSLVKDFNKDGRCYTIVNVEDGHPMPYPTPTYDCESFNFYLQKIKEYEKLFNNSQNLSSSDIIEASSTEILEHTTPKPFKKGLIEKTKIFKPVAYGPSYTTKYQGSLATQDGNFQNISAEHCHKDNSSDNCKNPIYIILKAKFEELQTNSPLKD